MRLDTKKLGAKISEYAVFIALVLLVVAMMIFADGFATSSNLLNLLRQAAFNGLIAFGMTLVILSDGIDLSVGSVFAIAAIICAELIMAGMSTVLAVLIALVAGTALGLVSGFLVAKCRLQAFIATLITMTAYRGVAYIITDGRPISRLAESAVSGSFFFKALGKGNVLMWILGAVGFCGSLLAFVLSFIPPGQIQTGSSTVWYSVLIAGCVVMVVIPYLIYSMRKPSWKDPDAEFAPFHWEQK